MDEVVQKLPFIPVAAPSITEREGELAQEAARFTLLSIGPYLMLWCIKLH